MSAIDTLTVHHVTVDANGEQVITRTTPYVKVKSAEGGPLFLKSGHAMDENGVIISPLPDWVKAEVRRMSPKAIDDIGFTSIVQRLDGSGKHAKGD